MTQSTTERPARCVARPTLAGALVLGLVLVGSGCEYMRTPYAIKMLNAPTSSGPGTKVPTRERVARLVKANMADAYLERPTATQWLATAAQKPAPLLELTACLAGRTAPPPGGDCYRAFTRQVLPTPELTGGELVFGQSLWGIAPPPIELGEGSEGSPTVVMTRMLTPGAPDATAARVEVDAERFVANARATAASLAMLEKLQASPIDPAELRAGLTAGLDGARAYVNARHWQRKVDRHATALVVSGGAANGAFGAGFVWRLLGILSSCQGQGSPQGCRGAKIDLAVGTSTGALISAAVDLFAVAGKEQAARKLLLDSYTCTVAQKLYCVDDQWDWALIQDMKGLVRFDGIEGLLTANITAASQANALELVTVAVDYDSGDIHADSDQDPSDAAPLDGRVQTVLASIVEPVMAQPIMKLERSNGPALTGTFIDGGIRSGLPVLEAMRRGAERVVVLSNSGIEADPIVPPKDAIQMLFRSIDLLTGQPRVAEVQEAEFGAIVRRLAEYNVCTDRLGVVTNASHREGFCQRRAGFGPSSGTYRMAQTAWVGPQSFPQVEQSWKTAWIYRPEAEVETATGYSFDPAVMRPQFKLGVRTFQSRCREMLALLEIGGQIANAACAEDPAAVEAAVEAQLRPEGECAEGRDEMRICG